MILAVFLLASVLANQEELSKSLGACWLMTIKSINENTKEMDLLIEKGSNKTAIYYKIQTSMIFKCLDKIEEGQGGKYLSDDGAKYTDVVQDFKYEDFKNQSFELTNDDLSLLKVIKTLEKGMGDLQKKREIEKKAKIGKNIEDQWEKTLNQPRIAKPQDVPFYYQIIFYAFIAILFVGGFLLVSYVRKIDNKSKTKTKQK